MQNYLPPFKKGAQVFSGNIAALWISGTIVSGKTTRVIAHNAGVKPKSIIITPLLSLAQAISASNIDVALAAASAANISSFFVIGSQPAAAAVKFAAYLQF